MTVTLAPWLASVPAKASRSDAEVGRVAARAHASSALGSWAASMAFARSWSGDSLVL